MAFLNILLSTTLSTAKIIVTYLLGLTVILFLSAIGLILLTPLVIFKQLVLYKLAPYVRCDLGKMVSSLGGLMACANVYKSPETKLNIALVMEGTPTKEKARSAVKAAFEAKDPTTGIAYYPELKQNVTKWMGYPFWKNVKDYNFDEHFLWCENEGRISHEELTQRLKERSFIPFTEDKALWRFAVYPNFLPNLEEPYYNEKSKYSLIIFEVSHCLLDGFALIKLLHKICGMKYTEVNEKPRKSFCERLLLYLCVLGKFPYDFGDLLLNSNHGTEIWPTPSIFNELSTNPRNYFLSSSSLVPFQRIREVREKLGVKSISLTVAAFAAAVRNVLFEGKKDTDVPKSVIFFIPFPLPGHPNKLRNHA
jgi:hypothetical protein